MRYQNANYSKDCFVAFPEDNKNGFKGREAYLLDALNGRYSGRYRGYVLPNSKREFLEYLVNNNWDANMRLFRDSPAVLISPENVEMSLAQAKKLFKNYVRC